MNLLETTKTSIKALGANKVRSALTMLGVIIGVFAVVMMVALGKGAQNYITDQFEALGSNLVFVSPGSSGFGRDPAESFTRNKLDIKHVELVNTQAKEFVKSTTPWISVGETARYKTKSYYASINAMNDEGVNIFNYVLDSGRFFTKSEVRGKAKVAILGPLVSKELFGNLNPLGKSAKIGDDSYEVIGTFAPKGQNYDNGIIMPYTSAMDSFDIKQLSGIAIKVTDENNIDTAMKQIEIALLRDLKPDDFSVLSQKYILSSIQDILGMLTLAIGGIAGISLVVGGIGIMNIMLVSVTERTREIGLRKAVGATPNNIAIQFLIESIMLSVGGGMIGLFIGWLGSLVARSFIRTEIPWWAVVLAFVFSVGVGTVFGTYPAIKAAKKDPIEALRYE